MKQPDWDGLWHIYRQHVGGDGKSVGRPQYYCATEDDGATHSWSPDRATCLGCIGARAREGDQLALDIGGPMTKAKQERLIP